jgi:protein O-GlcNAc transferase
MKIGPNAPCPCGSGKKFKKCHGLLAVSAPLQAGLADSWLKKGKQLEAAGRLPEAEGCYQQALKHEPRHAESWYALGCLADQVGDFEAAHACFQRLIGFHPRHPDGLLALGNAQARMLDFSEARKTFLRALEESPDMAAGWFNLGNIEKYLGRTRNGLEYYRRAISLNKDRKEQSRQHSSVLFALHRDETLSSEELFKEHQDWELKHASILQPLTIKANGNLDGNRPLRIGYVSGSFNGLIVGHFLLHVLEAHDRRNFHVALYSSTRHTDECTSRFIAACNTWKDIGNIEDAMAAELIHSDNIDILIDIDGHSPTGRPLLFAFKPAPIQISWLDWFNTTGLTTMDYILTDRYTTPQESSQRFTETPYRLPHSRLCYLPPGYSPMVTPPPVIAGLPPTYGSFNRQDKLHPELFRSWADILRATPGTRLILKNRALGVAAVRKETERVFREYGIAGERLVLRGPSDHKAMLSEYADIDIALDPYPYNGGLTSCECLWMGVPIVALEGERMIGRQTAAMLRLLGLDDWVATDRTDYVRLAIEKISDITALANLRSGLREHIANSPLTDATRFCRDLEIAFRRMWQHYCQC